MICILQLQVITIGRCAPNELPEPISGEDCTLVLAVLTIRRPSNLLYHRPVCCESDDIRLLLVVPPAVDVGEIVSGYSSSRIS